VSSQNLCTQTGKIVNIEDAVYTKCIPMSTLVYSEDHGWGATFTGITGIDEKTSVKFNGKLELMDARLLIAKLIPAAEKLIREGKGPNQ